MGAAIGQSLPLAVGVLVSPLPVVAVVLMLVSVRARSNGPAFVAGWVVAIGVVVIAAALLTGSMPADDDGPAPWVGWLKIVLGVLLLLVALKQWHGRPRDGAEPPAPAWMTAIDGFTPVRSAGLGALLAVVNPKNLLLVLSAGATIGSAAGGDTGAVIGAGVVFTVIAAVSVTAPVIVYLAMGERAAGPLNRLKTLLVHDNAVIMAVLLVVLGAKMIGDGLTIV